MSAPLRIITRVYCCLLLALTVLWLMQHSGAFADMLQSPGALIKTVAVIATYLLAHGFRMVRLGLLSLDERSQVLPLISAHSLTAFPSSFLPFKLGEILRLLAFYRVYQGRRKALALWLAERFGDVLVLTALILCLYIFNVNVPPSVRLVFILFVSAGLLGLLALFAVAKLFVYLNQHLVLKSSADRGLRVLRAAHAVRQIELDIYGSVQGRLSSFFLLSLLIWALEIASLSLFVHSFAIHDSYLAEQFITGLLASLPGRMEEVGLYQSFSLAILALVFLAIVGRAGRSKPQRSCNVPS